MSPVLKRMQELLAKQEQAQDNVGKGAGFGDNAVFRHWDIPVDGFCVLRFLPDGDDTNPFFWRHRFVRKIPFSGIVGRSDNKKVHVVTPAWNSDIEHMPPEYVISREADPIQDLIKTWWNEGRQEEYRVYKRKETCIYQSFVRNSGGVEEEAPENPIRRNLLNTKLQKKVTTFIRSPDNEHNPCDFEQGVDFIVNKTQSGEFSVFDTSEFSRKVTPLTDEELEAIDKFGLFKLSDYLPKPPNAEESQAIQEMFEVSVAGGKYDPEAWGKFYKPYGVQLDTSTVHQVKKNTPEDSDDEPDGSDSTEQKASLLEKMKAKHTNKEETAEAASPKEEKAAPEEKTADKKVSNEKLMEMLKKRKKEKEST